MVSTKHRQYVIYGLLALLALGVGYLCFLMALPFLVAISWAAVLATIFYPVFVWLKARVKSNGLAAGLTVVAVVLCLILPAIAIGASVWREVTHLIPPDKDASEITAMLSARADAATRWVTDHFGIENLNIGTLVVTALKNASEVLLAQTTSILGGVVGFVVNVIIVLFTLFFFLRDRETVVGAVKDFMPLSEANASEVLRRSRDVIHASVLGGGAVALAQGILGGIAYAIVGIDSPVLWGVVTAVFSFIPLLGAAGVWVPLTLVLLVQGLWGKAIVLLVCGVLGISLVDNFLRPIIIGETTKLHTLLIFFSILGGLRIFGFLGIIMGPVVLAVGLALVEIVRREIAEDQQRATGIPVAPAASPGPDAVR